MRPLSTDSPPGTQERREVLYTLLGTNVLESIAGLSPERILDGRPRPERPSPRKHVPVEPPTIGSAARDGQQAGHRHVWPELATLVDGEMDLFIDQQTYRARRGDWLVIRPDVLHGGGYTQTRAYYCLIWFEFDRPFPNLHVSEYRPGRGYESFGLFNLPKLPAYLRSSAAQLLGETWPPEAQARMHLLRLVTWVMELLDQHLHAKLSEAGRKVLAVQELIARSERAWPSVKQLAARVGLSANYLSSLFHTQTGTTIRQYITDRRIESAKRCLSDANCSIKEVADRLGFKNPYHFSSAFHRATGLRPSAYRQLVNAAALRADHS